MHYPSRQPLKERPVIKATSRVSWDDQGYRDLIGEVPMMGTERALFRLTRQLPELVWNAAALEGNTFTLPEVRTLLDGVTVGGKTLSEQSQVLNLSAAFNELHAVVANGKFALKADMSHLLHSIIAADEALDAGMFRGQGAVHGDSGGVQLMSGGYVPFDSSDELPEAFADLQDSLESFAHPVERALAYFCSATRSQFYFDGNKRTARLVASGMLMSVGYAALNVPNARRLEFNLALDTLFLHDDATELMAFLVECLLDASQR